METVRVSTKTFVLTSTKLVVHDPPDETATTDRRGAGDPAGAVEPRTQHGARSGGGDAASGRLHHGAEYAADHDGEGPRGAQRSRAHARLRSGRLRDIDPAPAGHRLD